MSLPDAGSRSAETVCGGGLEKNGLRLDALPGAPVEWHRPHDGDDPGRPIRWGRRAHAEVRRAPETSLELALQ